MRKKSNLTECFEEARLRVLRAEPSAEREHSILPILGRQPTFSQSPLTLPRAPAQQGETWYF